MTSKQSPPSEYRIMRYVRLDADMSKIMGLYEAAEARCAQLEWEVSTLRYAAKGGNATKGNVEALRHAADELTRLGSPELSFISALRQRAAMIEGALSDTAPDTWNPDHPNFGKTAPDTAQRKPKR